VPDTVCLATQLVHRSFARPAQSEAAAPSQQNGYGLLMLRQQSPFQSSVRTPTVAYAASPQACSTPQHTRTTSPVAATRVPTDRTPEDIHFINRDLPHVRADLSLDGAGFAHCLGRWSPALVPNRSPLTVMTLDGTTGGTAGPMRGKAHYLALDTPGLYDELARRLPTTGVSVLQLAFHRPGPHRFSECVDDAVSAASQIAKNGRVLLVGHSMGGAVALAASLQMRQQHQLCGVCALSSQTFGVPATVEMRRLLQVPVLLVHGTADQALPADCSEEIWHRLSTIGGRPSHLTQLVLMDGTGHHLEERREEVSELVHSWILRQTV